MAAAGITTRRRVPLPAPPARRDAVRRPERDGARPGRGGPRGRDPDRAARHLLPLQRVRRTARGSASALLRRVRGRLGCQDGAIAPERRAGVVIGAAIHSVRAVPADQMPARRASGRGGTSPLHVHLSEQVAENQACVAEYARTPTEVLADHELLGPEHHRRPRHPPHRRRHPPARQQPAPTPASARPPSATSATASAPAGGCTTPAAVLTLGSDSHAVIDLFEEMRAVELDERLATQQRGHWSAAELLAAATTHGHASLGFDDAGAIAVGQRADLVTIDTTTPAHRRHRRRREHRRLRRHRRGRHAGDGRRPGRGPAG